MEPLIIYQRKARTHTDLIEELVAYVLRSSAWTERDRDSLTDAISDAISDWMDATIAKGDH